MSGKAADEEKITKFGVVIDNHVFIKSIYIVVATPGAGQFDCFERRYSLGEDGPDVLLEQIVVDFNILGIRIALRRRCAIGNKPCAFGSECNTLRGNGQWRDANILAAVEHERAKKSSSSQIYAECTMTMKLSSRFLGMYLKGRLTPTTDSPVKDNPPDVQR